MPTNKEKITSKAIALLETEPNAIRYSDLVRRMQEEFPDIPVNTIHGTVWNLDARFPKLVYKAARGLFRHTKYREKVVGEVEGAPTPMIVRVKEEDFYPPFAEWLINEVEECTKAIALGGNKFKDKWGHLTLSEFANHAKAILSNHQLRLSPQKSKQMLPI